MSDREARCCSWEAPARLSGIGLAVASTPTAALPRPRSQPGAGARARPSQRDRFYPEEARPNTTEPRLYSSTLILYLLGSRTVGVLCAGTLGKPRRSNGGPPRRMIAAEIIPHLGCGSEQDWTRSPSSARRGIGCPLSRARKNIRWSAG